MGGGPASCVAVLTHDGRGGRAGQGVVAFAVGASDRLGYAIKFFVAPSAFVAERQLYESRVLGALLPKIEDVYDPSDTPGRFVDRHGSPLPPCIVMERGESLNEWSRRAKPDVFQAVAVRLPPPCPWECRWRGPGVQTWFRCRRSPRRLWPQTAACAATVVLKRFKRGHLS